MRMFLFHADDYGVNINQAKRILNCWYHGVLQSVSILPNSLQIAESAAILPNAIKKSIHINLVEGMCMSDAAKIPLLADRTGKFYQSFLKLFLLSVFRKKEIRKQSAIECSAQIQKVLEVLPADYQIRIDSHRHYHMIPAVFEGMCIACKKSGREVEHIRFPVESIQAYLCNLRLWHAIKPINLVKIMVLRCCARSDRLIAKKYGLWKKPGGFIGLMFTTQMDIRYVEPILSFMKKHRNRKDNREVEVLFHPGGIKPGEACMDADKKSITAFYYSKNRWMEADTLKKLKTYGY